MSDLKKLIRDVPDFPKPGILFRDITPLLKEPSAFRLAVDRIVERYRGEEIDQILGIESRGFILGSAVAYQLEQKRPTLTRLQWWLVGGGLLLADVVCVMSVWWRRQHHFAHGTFAQSLRVETGLIYPLLMAPLFVAIAIILRRRARDARTAGQKIMLAGLLWLIVYDVCFVGGYLGAVPALLLLLFAPAAYLSVQLMRWWGNLLSISQRPAFQRAR